MKSYVCFKNCFERFCQILVPDSASKPITCPIFNDLAKWELYYGAICSSKETRACDLKNQHYLGQSISGWVSDCKMAESNIDNAYKVLHENGLPNIGYKNLSEAIKLLLKIKMLDPNLLEEPF